MLVRLISWSKDRAERARLLEASGFSVDASEHDSGRTIGQTNAIAPAAILIDLDRMPSHGRAVATVLRSTKSTCHFPIVFAGGEPEKVEGIRAHLPNEVFVAWKSAAAALKRAMKKAPPPAMPRPYMGQWKESSLARKLGLKAASKVALLGAPEGFEEQTGDPPEGLEFQSSITRQTSLVIWFVRSRQELEGEVAFVSARLPEGASVWIAFPKQASRLRVDFNSNDVRAAGLAAGLVDYKVCAIDADWSGLKFARKKR